MIGLLFGAGAFRTILGNEYGNIELDATLNETHVWDSKVTEYPVEEGSPVTDHIILSPDKLRIEGFISDHPILASNTIQAYITGIAGISGITSVGDRVDELLGNKQTEKRSLSVFNLLRTLRDKKEVLTVYTKYRIYTDMMLSTLSIPRDAGDGEGIKFEAEFVNVRFVETQFVDSPKKKKGKVVGNKAGKQTQAKKDGGDKQPKELPQEKSEAASIIDKGIDAIKSAFGF